MNPSDTKPAVRLLIVDDEESQIKALCALLRKHGYETVGFSSAKAGLDALRQSKFDLLLFDLGRPEIDAISLLRSALEIDPDLVGVIMTGQGTIETAAEAMKTGAIDFIQKPFKSTDVLLVLSRALAIRQLRVENSELQQRLQQNAGELQKANQEFESFAHSVSHDLRAPLRAIGGFSNILLKDFAPKIPDEARRLLNIVVSSGTQLSHMIDGLLEFSRLGRQPLSMHPTDLNNSVKQILNELHSEHKQRVELKLGDLPPCLGDPALLKQIFTNLLSNAFKFTTQAQHPVIEIGSRPGDREHIYFVRDNGIGFDMQYAERLFGVFVRLHSEREFLGDGLGLATAQRIIQRHGGRIWAEAEPNKGATFFFTLPAAT
jgi:two-component system sensor histidine kinase/response regulator